MESSCREYGWEIEYVIDQPIMMLMLMLRQKHYVDSGGKAITLLQQDSLRDCNLSWEEQVRKNREELAKKFKM